MCLVVVGWVLAYNPNCEIFCENVDFSDMAADWAEVCKALGTTPKMVTADCCSFTRRRRAYWTNMPLPDTFLDGCTPGDPDSCMDEGRIITKYKAWGKDCVYPIGASWSGPHDNPYAYSARAILVNGHLHLRPHEAELLMGLPRDSTAGNRVTWKQRLQCIGDGWDMNVILQFFKHSLLVHPRYEGVPVPVPTLLCLSLADQHLQQGLLMIAEQQGSAAVAAALAQYSRSEQEHMISLIAHGSSKDGSAVMALQELSDSVLDSGSSRHIHPRTIVTDADMTVALTGFDQSTQWTQGGGYLPVEWISRETGNAVSYDVDDVDSLSRVSHPILPMGKLIRKGFDFFLGDYGRDMYASAPGGAYTVKLNLGIDDVVRIPHSLRTGKHKARLPEAVSIGLGSEGVLDGVSLPAPALAVARDPQAPDLTKANSDLECQLCESDAKIDTQGSALSVSRTAKEMNGIMLHQMLNHSGDEKMYQTLLHTTGYKPTRFKLHPCIWCALGKSTKIGISHKKHPDNCISDLKDSAVNLVVQDGVTQYTLQLNTTSSKCYDDSDEDGAPEDNDELEEVLFEADVAGRTLGEQLVPRYDLSKLRPFEVMFADNKEYPCKVRGGKQHAFVLIDYYSQAKCKIDVATKTHNGKAFLRIMAMNGVHKLPYQCHIWTDRCGSMAHVRNAATRADIDHAYTPPRDPSLNEAEKVCNFMWAASSQGSSWGFQCIHYAIR